MTRLSVAAMLLVAALAGGCGSDDGAISVATVSTMTVGTPEATPEGTGTATATEGVPTPTPSPTEAPPETPSPTVDPTAATSPVESPTEVVEPTAAGSPPPPTATSTSTPVATPTVAPSGEGMDIRATRLRIPSLGIDSEVHGSQEIPDTSPMPPGCPAKPAGQTTLTVPSQGIATPEETFAGLERKSWIFGHSRWQGEPGLFFALQGLWPGDELFIDGIDRGSGETVSGRRFVIDGLFLADTVSGGSLVTGEQQTPTSQVILQTSVRERGEGKAWIFDRETLLQKSVNIVEGDLEDPCKYLLLFVVASAS